MKEFEDKYEKRSYRFGYKKKVSRDLIFLIEALKKINSNISIAFIKNYGLNKELFLVKTDITGFDIGYDEEEDEITSSQIFKTITNLTNSVFFKTKYCFFFRVNLNNSLFALTKFYKDKIKISNRIHDHEKDTLEKDPESDIEYKDVVITIKNYNKKEGARHRIMKNYYILTPDAYKFAKEGKPQYAY